MKARSILNFKGKNAVIGCYHSRHGANSQCLGLCHPYENFFSIDNRKHASPDLNIPFSNRDLPEIYNQKFSLTLVENLHPDSYTNYFLKNIFAITNDDGFIFIKSCPRERDFRILLKGKRYIELPNDFEENSCVLIPKDQTISIDELKQKIKKNSAVSRLILAVTPATQATNIDVLTYCNIDADTLPKTVDNLAAKNVPNEHLRQSKLKEEIENLYVELKKLSNYATSVNPTYNHHLRNPTLDLAKCLIKKSNDFFSQPEIERDDKMVAYKNEMSTILTNILNEDLVKSDKFVLRILANIAVVLLLPIAGIFAVGYQMHQTKKTCGRYLPLFFDDGKYTHSKNIKDKVDNLPDSYHSISLPF